MPLSSSANTVSANASSSADLLAPLDTFVRRHNGSGSADEAAMLASLGYASLDALVDAAVPPQIRLGKPLNLPAALSESSALAELRTIAKQNEVFRSFIGQGYYGTHT